MCLRGVKGAKQGETTLPLLLCYCVPIICCRGESRRDPAPVIMCQPLVVGAKSGEITAPVMRQLFVVGAKLGKTTSPVKSACCFS